MSSWLMDNYTSPEFKKKLSGEKIISKRYSAKSCNDDITFYFDIENDQINDISFEGDGCALSIACSNSFCRLIKNGTISKAKDMANLFLNSVESKMFSKELNNELVNFEKNISTGRRKTCLSIAPNIISNL